MNHKFGEYFQKLRAKRNLTKEELAKVLKISEAQIDLIEKGEFKKIPHFILKQILERYKKFFKIEDDFIKTLNLITFSDQEVKAKKIFSFNIPWFLVFSLLIIGVLIFQIYEAFLPPKIEIISPKNNSYFLNNQILIKGYVDKRSTLYINKEQTFFDEKGYFEKTAILRPGLNKFILEATNHFGVKNSKEIDVYYLKY